ncbi:MAG: hypothetical protein COB53_00375 [Elusimicrobia bacterium]|nr:MAG: hypothetical protein COB53_00375 [Elusimicrobiota bacterium]
MLPCAVALTAAGSLLLLGSVPAWAHATVLVPTAGLLTFWGLSRVFIGHVTLPSHRNLVWAGVLAALAALSSLQSPQELPPTAVWIAWNALWLFPVIAFISKDERTAIDDAVRCAAWILMVLAFYQRLVLGIEAPASALPSSTAYAATVLLLIPLALERRDRLLACGLLITLLWSASVGAWLGLFAAFTLLNPWTPGFRLYAGLTGVVVCAIVIYGRIDSVEVIARAEQWVEAWRWIGSHPLLGMGPGSWKPDSPAAYPLVVAAEFGVPFALLWFAGIWHCLTTGGSYKRFGALAVLMHSIWDPVFMAPANLWLLCYCTASSISEGSEGVEIPVRWRLPAAAAIAFLGFFIGRSALAAWGGH